MARASVGGRTIAPAELLFSQGFGTRRDCAAMVLAGRLEVEGLGVVRALDAAIAIGGPFCFRVDGGERWPFRETAIVALHKPAGYECSTKPGHHPSVHALLPEPLRRRGVQPVGRLDEDTTGVLLFTDDGALLHRLTSPRRHVEKVYEVGCRHVVDDGQIERLRSGVVLRGADAAVRALACERTGERTVRLVLDEGKYHQVKRMVAAVGNRVEQLHREAFANVRVDALRLGAWRWVDAAEVAPA